MINNQDIRTAKKSRGSKAVKAYIFLFLFAIVFVAGLVLGIYSKGSGQTSAQVATQTTAQLTDIFAKNKDIDVGIFKQAWDVIHTEYLDKNKINDKDLFYGAIAGMVDALGDQHTVFLTPTVTNEFTQELDGSFYGIGAEIGRKNGYLVVIAPLNGSPAEQAGLQAGDKILAIDKADTAKMSVTEAIYKIRGENGTTVVLNVLSKDGKEAHDVTIKRAKIDIPSVKYKLDNNIAIIEVTGFNSDTADRFTQVVQKVLKDNPRGIILDLRNDPGGFLDTAVQIASSWLEPGQVVVKETYGDQKNDIEHKAIKRLSLAKYQTVVLVNEGSASASEIVAGALQDYGLAKIVGMTTFGKGSVQQLIPLTDNSSIKVTVARWLTPKGRTIDGQGITPDVKVDFTEDDYNKDLDPQLDKAKELLLP